MSCDRFKIDRPRGGEHYPKLPWCVAQNGAVIGRFMFRTDAVDFLRRRIDLNTDISQFRYWYEEGAQDHAA